MCIIITKWYSWWYIIQWPIKWYQCIEILSIIIDRNAVLYSTRELFDTADIPFCSILCTIPIHYYVTIHILFCDVPLLIPITLISSYYSTIHIDSYYSIMCWFNVKYSDVYPDGINVIHYEVRISMRLKKLRYIQYLFYDMIYDMWCVPSFILPVFYHVVFILIFIDLIYSIPICDDGNFHIMIWYILMWWNIINMYPYNEKYYEVEKYRNVIQYMWNEMRKLTYQYLNVNIHILMKL